MSGNDLHHGIARFNRGEYFEAHEALEDAWRGAPAEDKQFLQGLVQAAVGMHHFRQGNMEGARGVLARALRNLQPYAPERLAIRVAPLLESLREWRSCAENGGSLPTPPRIQQTSDR